MQDFTQEKKMLKYWYCTFSTLNQILSGEFKSKTSKYLICIQDTLEK